ncbi:blastula protease 10-like [Oculina patagonica]
MLLLCILILATPSLAEILEDDSNQKDSFEGEYFEGDLKLSREQMQELKSGIVGGARGLGKNRQWPGGIVYYTINTRRPLRKAVIRSAIREWEEFTCIRFKERTNENAYIEFMVGKGCYSTSVGRGGGRQLISLGVLCATHGVAVHEIGHALGFWHEQSRPDRDKYVEILWDNIQEDKKTNFNKYSHGMIDSLGSPYDYNSIMHYGKRYFAKRPWQTTIRAKNGNSLGRWMHLSPLDIEQMNKYYNCNKK